MENKESIEQSNELSTDAIESHNDITNIVVKGIQPLFR